MIPTTPNSTSTGRPFGHAGVLLLLLWCGFLFFYGLGQGELYRTESLRAIVAQEFLRSGNWIVPTLYGEPLFTKPPGMYAAIALVSLPLGHVTEWSARLPSALAATVTVLLMAWTFRRYVSARAGFLAGLLMPVSLLWLDKATAADIDMMQVAWVTGAIVCFLRALETADSDAQPTAAGDCRWWIAALLCVAGGVLTKWTAPVFFYATVVTLLWQRRRLQLLGHRTHIISVAVAAVPCLLWATAAIHLTGWDIFCQTIAREATQRLAPSHHQHGSMWLEMVFHPLLVLAAGLPISAMAVLTLRSGFRERFGPDGQRLLIALHCWTWPNLLFWSLLPQHNVRYFFPLAPGLAGLGVFGVLYAWQVKARLRRARLLGAVLIAWIAVKLIYVHVTIPDRLRQRQPGARGLAIASVVPAGETLYLFRFKDEGILFYYDRPAVRLTGPGQLTSRTRPAYCILNATDRQAWPFPERTHTLLQLTDEQGDPIRLVRLDPAASSERLLSMTGPPP